MIFVSRTKSCFNVVKVRFPAGFAMSAVNTVPNRPAKPSIVETHGRFLISGQSGNSPFCSSTIRSSMSSIA